MYYISGVMGWQVYKDTSQMLCGLSAACWRGVVKHVGTTTQQVPHRTTVDIHFLVNFNSEHWMLERCAACM
jgi:hypothetical protein